MLPDFALLSNRLLTDTYERGMRPSRCGAVLCGAVRWSVFALRQAWVDKPTHLPTRARDDGLGRGRVSCHVGHRLLAPRCIPLS